jgi:hypothetical protein
LIRVQVATTVKKILDPQLCLREIPLNLRTWVQPSISASYDSPNITWIRINRKSGNASPPTRTILSFWCQDVAFAEFLRLFPRRIKKLVESGVKVAVNPDISIFWDDDEKLARKIFEAQLKFGLLMQRAGMMILPNVPLLHPRYAERLYSDLLPRGVPLAIQTQTATRPLYGNRDYDNLRRTIDCLETAVGIANPPEVLLYGAKSIFEVLAAGFSKPRILRHVSNFSDILNGKGH